MQNEPHPDHKCAGIACPVFSFLRCPRLAGCVISEDRVNELIAQWITEHDLPCFQKEVIERWIAHKDENNI